MISGGPSTLFADWLTVLQDRLPWVLLGTGFVVLSIALLVLMLSRLGHARPLSKCVVLSVYAHFLLLGYAYMVNLFHESPASQGSAAGVRIALVDDLDLTGPTLDQTWPSSEVSPAFDELLLSPEPVPLDPAPAPPDRQLSDVSSVPDSGPLPIPQLNVPEPADASLAPPKHPVAASTIDATLLEPQQDVVTTPAPSRAPADLVADTAPPAVDRAPADDMQAGTQTVRDLQIDSESGELFAGARDRTKAVFASDRGIPDNTPRTIAAAAATVGASSERARQRDLPVLYRERQNPQRIQTVIAQGGSRETEQAVRDALAWIASAQDPIKGCWNTAAWEGGREVRDFSNIHDSARPINADTALTGLAILSFLGAGFTHQQGTYQHEINAGLQFLCQSQTQADGSLAGDAGRFVAMYCHGIATLALSEAYALTGDQEIRPYLERAIRYTIKSQHPSTGGWRYVPGDAGDTSQFGWQLMSLISARNGGLEIPEKTWIGVNRWLRLVAMGQHGGLACYSPSKRAPSTTMTAEALTCRLFLQGMQQRSAVDEAADHVLRHGLGKGPMNLYYFYYATLALHQLQDERWTAWNKVLTRQLLKTQRTDGQMAGSWDTDTAWGSTGGRVYTTSLATLCLESYYRYLPLGRLGTTDGKHRSAAKPRVMQLR